MKDTGANIILGIVVAEFDLKIGPVPLVFTHDVLESKALSYIATRTIDYLEDSRNLPSAIIIFEFPPLKKKGFVKYFSWKDDKLRGGVSMGSITLLYDEKDDAVIYKYRQDFEKPLQDFSEILVRLKNQKAVKKQFLIELNRFEDHINALMLNLAKQETTTNLREFPEAEEGANKNIYIAKIIIVGDPSVGKSSLILQYTDKAFRRSYIPTIGTNITEKNIDLGGRTTQLVLWDVAGQEKFNIMRQQFYKGAAGAILVFDLTDLLTFENIPRWYQDLKSNLSDFGEVGVVLCGNKADLIDKRKVSKNQCEAIAAQYDLPYIETSALTGENVNVIFSSLVNIIQKKNPSFFN